MIKKPLIIFGMAIIIATAPACENGSAKTASGKALDSVYNAGPVSIDTFKHTFYIKSAGSADLKIDTVVSSCDCTVADWQKGAVKPGDSAYVNVSVKPDSADKGKQIIKNIVVRTNGNSPLNTLTIAYQLK